MLRRRRRQPRREKWDESCHLLHHWRIPRGASGLSLLKSSTERPAPEGSLDDPRAIVTVPVKRGVVTHVVLDAHESISEVGVGLGADCSKPDASWCIAAQPGGRNIFVKPKSTARAPNNLAVVTEQRTYALRFVV